MSVISRVMGGQYVASRFRPTRLKSAQCVLWLDTLERSSYVVTPGAGGALPTVGTITNLASGVAWTEASLPPYYEIAHGRPWLLNHTGVSASARRLSSTEAAVLDALGGTDTSFTLAIAYERLAVDVGTSVLFGAASTLSAAPVVDLNHSAGRFSLTRRDDANTSSGGVVSCMYSPGPRVLVARFSAPQTHVFCRDAEAALASAPATDIGAITLTRAGLFGRLSAAPGLFSEARIGGVCLFAGALSDEDLRALQLWYVSRWTTPVHDAWTIPNVTNAQTDRIGTTTGNVSVWVSPDGSGWAPPAGKEPTLDMTRPTPSIKFIAANNDCMLNNVPITSGSAATVGLTFRLDAAPAAGQVATLASYKFAAGDNWFEVIVANEVSGTKTISFARQGLTGNYVGFDLPEGALDGSIHRLLVTYDGTNYTARWDGVAQTVVASGAYTRTTGDKGSLGARVSSADVTSQGLDGRLLKNATHGRVLNAAELDQLDLYLADGWTFSPDILPNRRIDINLKDADSYEVSAGTVQSIRNRASHVLWTEDVTPPLYEAAGLNGHPCLHNPAGDSRRIISTEAAAVSTFSGEDAPHTVYLVVQPETLDETSAYLGYGLSTQGATRSCGGYGNSESSNGRRGSAIKLDDASGGGLLNAAQSPPPAAHVLSFRTSANGQEIYAHLNDGANELTATAFNRGITTPDRVSLFGVPANVQSYIAHGRLGRALAFAEAHTEATQRAVARYLASEWDLAFCPMTIPGLVAWFDMLEASSYTVAGGLITSIKNLVSNTAWNTAATAFPLFEATGLGGRPCMRGEATVYGGASNRGILSAESAVASAFAGDDTPWTIIAVTQPIAPTPVGGFHAALFGAGNSGVASNQTTIVQRRTGDNGNYQVVKIDDAGAGASSSSIDEGALVPRVMTLRSNGATLDVYTNSSQSQFTAPLNVGTLTPNQCALFCRPDSAPDTFGVDRLSELLIYNRALTDAERVRIVTNRMSRWGVT